MISKPRIEARPEQHYLGIRTSVKPSKFKKIIPEYLDEIFGWLTTKGLKPESAPFLRYYVIDMGGEMDVEVGVPVAGAMQGEGRIQPGIIPAGNYAALTYSRVGGITGNKALIEWARDNGVQWDRWDDPKGDAFRSRVEYFLTDPAEEPDRKKWATEVAILTKS